MLGRRTIAVAIPFLTRKKFSLPFDMKTELDLLAEALQRLDLHYRQREQELERQLTALAARIESLGKHANDSNAYVSSVTGQLTRSQDQQLSALIAQIEALLKQVSSL